MAGCLERHGADSETPAPDAFEGDCVEVPPLEERLAALRLGMSPDRVAAILRVENDRQSQVGEADSGDAYLRIVEVEIAEPVRKTMHLRYFCGGLASWRMGGDWVDVPHVPGTCTRCGWPRAAAGDENAVQSGDGRDPDCPVFDDRAEQVYEAHVRADDQLAETVLDSVRIEGPSFEQAIQTVQENTHLTVDLDWERLREAGIERDTHVSLRLMNVKFKKFLEILLNAVQPKGQEIGYEIIGDRLVISTRADLLRRVPVITRSYLVEGVPGVPGSEHRKEELGEFIRRIVLPGSWKGADGELGTLAYNGNCLIVSHSPSVHRRVDEVLRQLRTPRCGNCFSVFEESGAD